MPIDEYFVLIAGHAVQLWSGLGGLALQQHFEAIHLLHPPPNKQWQQRRRCGVGETRSAGYLQKRLHFGSSAFHFFAFQLDLTFQELRLCGVGSPPEGCWLRTRARAARQELFRPAAAHRMLRALGSGAMKLVCLASLAFQLLLQLRDAALDPFQLGGGADRGGRGTVDTQLGLGHLGGHAGILEPRGAA